MVFGKGVVADLFKLLTEGAVGADILVAVAIGRGIVQLLLGRKQVSLFVVD